MCWYYIHIQILRSIHPLREHNLRKMCKSTRTGSVAVKLLINGFSSVVVVVLFLGIETKEEQSYSLPLQHKRNEGPHCHKAIESGRIIWRCQNYYTIPTDIPNPEDIKLFDMSKGNYISTLIYRVLFNSKLINIVELNLSNCSIRSIDDGAFEGMEYVRILDISYNRIKVLNPKVFEGLEIMRMLIIAHNPIQMIMPQTIFPVLPQLTRLFLNHCLFTEFTNVDIFKNLNMLTQISLQNNLLTTINYTIFSIPSLEFINLAGNNWMCDCHIKFLMEDLSERGLSSSYSRATCATTGSLRSSSINKTWENIPTSEMICKPTVEKLDLSGYKGENTSHNVVYGDAASHIVVNVATGQDIYFNCEYHGDPKPNFKWLKNDKLITGNKTLDDLIQSVPKDLTSNFTQAQSETPHENYSKYNYKFKGSLLIQDVEEDDSGIYACYVSDGYGNHDTKVLNVSVTNPYLGKGFRGNAGAPGELNSVSGWMWMLIVGLACILILGVYMLLIWFRTRRDKPVTSRKQ